MARLGDVVSVSASTQQIDAVKFWLLNLDMVEQQTGEILSYNFVSNDKLNGSIVQFDVNNVLYSKLRPNLNKVVVPKQSGFATSEMLPLRPDTKVLTREYLGAYLRSDSFVNWAISKTAGAKMPRLATKELLNKDIPIPSVQRQIQITGTLDKLTHLISLRKQQLVKLDELVKARFVEMFGDPKDNPNEYSKKQLKKTCNVITGNTPSRALDAYYGDYIEWIKTDNIVSGLLHPTTAVEYLSEKGMSVSRTVEKNSILMACIAGSISSIGKICVTDRKVAFNQQINAIVPNEYNIFFLYVLLQLSKEYLVEEINMSLKGILSKSKLEEKTFIVPPMELQEQFAAFVEQTNKSKLTIQQSLDKMEVLKWSLMQEYFG